MLRLIINCGVLYCVMHLLSSQAPSQSLSSFKPFYEKQRAQPSLLDARSHTLASAKNYDVLHYDVNVMFLPPYSFFTGSVTMTVMSLADSIALIEYDFAAAGMVDSVYIDGVRAPFVHVGDIISVPLSALLHQGSTAKITTVYSCSLPCPAIAVTQRKNTDKDISCTVLASNAEPYGSRTWWPCKDDAADKADSVDVTVTTETSYTPVSNGILVSDVPNTDSTHTVHWKTNYPIATYLISVALSNYNINEYTWEYNGYSMPVSTWYYSRPWAVQQHEDSVMLRALSLFSSQFGVYPFVREKYGMAEFSWGGAMENQTVATMGYFVEELTVHELAHQWFGDKVTCAGFEDVWLNEGWAKYCEMLYREHYHGTHSLQEGLYPRRYFGPGTVYVENPESKTFEEMFNHNLRYNKAAWIVHMLRGITGDSIFFRAARKYLGDNERESFRSVRTKDLQEAFESETGTELSYFFDEWIHGEYYPTYYYYWSTESDSAGYKLTITVEQLQDSMRPLFSMPIQFRIIYSGGDTLATCWNSSAYESYTIRVPGIPGEVILDPDNYILHRTERKPYTLVNGNFERTVLLINGNEWSPLPETELLRSSLRDSVFTGTWPFQFYDLYLTPTANYPPGITHPNGTLAPSAEDLQKYCTVIWLAQGDETDLKKWNEAPIYDYLQNGGNVVLICLNAQSFIDDSLKAFLGVSWLGKEHSTIGQAVSHHPLMVNMDMEAEQYPVALMKTSFGKMPTTLLFTDDTSYNIPVATGIWAKPRITPFGESGHFVLLSMAGHRVNPQQLKHNLSVLLDSIMCASQTGIATGETSGICRLGPCYPNPVSKAAGTMVIPFSIGGTVRQHFSLQMLDLLGRNAGVVMEGVREPGEYTIPFDVSTLLPGCYLCRLTIEGKMQNRLVIIEQ